METGRASNHLASSRCELGYDPEQRANEFYLLGELRQLKCLRVYSNTSCRSVQLLDNIWVWFPVLQQRFFEPWVSTATSVELDALNRRLIVEFPELHYWRVSRPKLKDINASRRVRGLLMEIENYEVTDPKDILVSNIHVTLQKLSSHNLDKHAFFDQAQRILQKWEPLLQRVLEEVHWAFEGGFLKTCLRYVHQKHTIRSSSDAFDVMIYGANKLNLGEV
ncbi:hypothetical protein BDZ97DRAFT_552324 [Flammula alnicola]|nr:hypothetical protein BDZ97DRAFT_552324 [Flammula alnicola]